MGTTTPTKAWFAYALDLNRIGFDLLRNATTAKSESAAFAIHGLFVPVHQSFQSALLLAERGLVGDARTVLRSGVEGTIAIYALHSDAAFIDRLIEAPDAILAAIGKEVSQQAIELVAHQPEPWAQPIDCFRNIARKIAESGGSAQCGFTFHHHFAQKIEGRPLYIYLTHHAAWVSPAGAGAASVNSSRAPFGPRCRRRSSLRIRLRCANSISIFLRSRREVPPSHDAI
ncbi:hypothetical protein ACVILL_001188 [Bradyrhizobium sp. USDA 3364]